MMPWRTRSIQNPRRAGVIFQAWSIHLYGQWLDTVFLNAISDSGDPGAAETVRQSLIAQGYDDRIAVRLWRCISVQGN
jgi:hypothetical protein